MVYGIEHTYYHGCREQGGGWHCPKCMNSISWRGETDNMKLKRQLEAAEREKQRLRDAALYQQERKNEALAEAEHFRKSRDGMKGALRKLKLRVGRGVCPCCNRTFADLARHMQSKHPEVATGETP